MIQLNPRFPAVETESAQRFLELAAVSVEHAVNAAIELRDHRREKENKRTTGGLSDNLMDLLRAAITFAGAGVDAALKRLIRDCLPRLCEIDPDVDRRLREFTRETIVSEGNRTALADVLLSAARSPRDALIDLYIGHLTTDSLQSAEEMENVCAALGVADPDLRRRIGEAKGAKGRDQPLRLLFTARNQIVHELDLEERQPTKAGERRRRSRRVADVQSWTTEGLEVAQRIIDDVGRRLAEAS